MDGIVWYRQRQGVGERCIDLRRCVRFVCETMGEDSDRDLVYYEDEGPAWFRYTCYQDPVYEYRESYDVADPEEVAFHALRVPKYKDLTPALQKYRKYGDLDVYREWSKERHKSDKPALPEEAPTPGPGEAREEAGSPRYEFGSGRFYLDGELVMELAPQARNRRAVLGALERNGWSSEGTRVRPGDRWGFGPTTDEESEPLDDIKLYEAVRGLNQLLEHTLYIIVRDNSEVRWRRR